MKDENIPEFESGDHGIIWKKIHENSTAIEVLKSDMNWVKKLLIAILVGIIITFLSTVV